MARRRYQKGSLIQKGTREKCWYARWLDDVIRDGQLTRIHRCQKIGTLEEFPTKRLAWREMEKVLATVNSSAYRPTVEVSFLQLSTKWKAMILPQHKPASQASEKGHIDRHLVPFFGPMSLNEITGEVVQRFVTSTKVAPKTIRNITDTFRLVWKTGKAWGYVKHDPLEGVVMPRLSLDEQPNYSAEQVRQIIANAREPYQTMFWVIGETGMRGGEACGLLTDDIDFQQGVITVQRSAWRAKLQAPKTKNAVRCLPISEALLDHIQNYLQTSWLANSKRLLFTTQAGNPLDNSNVVKQVLRPITNRLGFQAAGLHALRHMNATELDRMGAPVAVRRERLGHAQFTTTLRYTHALSADHKQVAAQLGQVLCPSLP
jgi:integrase